MKSKIFKFFIIIVLIMLIIAFNSSYKLLRSTFQLISVFDFFMLKKEIQ